MLAISKNSNISQESLSKSAGIVPSMVNRYLKDFEEKNYINKMGESRRKMNYEITLEGKNRLQFLTVSLINEVTKMYSETKGLLGNLIFSIEKNKLNNVYLYGAGVIGKTVLQVLNSENINVLGFIDDSEAKCGEKIFGLDIFSPNSIVNKNYDGVIIASFRHAEEILNKSISKGIKKIYIFKIDSEGKVSLSKEG